jgi:hypothetical protein
VPPQILSLRRPRLLPHHLPLLPRLLPLPHLLLALQPEQVLELLPLPPRPRDRGYQPA